LGLIYGLSFQIQAASHFPLELKKNGILFYLEDFPGRSWRIPGLYETKVGFILIGPNSQAEDLAVVNHVTR